METLDQRRTCPGVQGDLTSGLEKKSSETGLAIEETAHLIVSNYCLFLRGDSARSDFIFFFFHDTACMTHDATNLSIVI